MARGDFGKAFSFYRAKGGVGTRADFGKTNWKEYLPKDETPKQESSGVKESDA